MDIAKNARDDEIVFEIEDLRIFLGYRTKRRLSNSIIDFSADKGFVITGMSC